MNENNIDELLNAFVDDQLNPRHQTEVKRLIDHDPNIAQKLRRIQSCKKLVNALPVEQAPEHLFDDIRSALERTTLLSEPVEHLDQQKGVRQLMFRKLLSLAAMFALVAGLAVVVINVVMPNHKPQIAKEISKPVETKNIEPIVTEKTIAAAAPAATLASEKNVTEIVPSKAPVAENVTPVFAFDGRLELKALDFGVADQMIAKSLTDNQLADQSQTSNLPTGQKVFNLSCSHEKLVSFLSNLSDNWSQFDSARLKVASDKQSTIINAITAEQILEIARQSDPEKQIKAVKYFAFTNNIKQTSDQILTAKENDFLNIPQPTLTGSSPKENLPTAKSDRQKVQLVIVLTK